MCFWCGWNTLAAQYERITHTLVFNSYSVYTMIRSCISISDTCHIHTYIHIRTRTHTCTHIHTHMHKHTHIHTHKNIHIYILYLSLSYIWQHVISFYYVKTYMWISLHIPYFIYYNAHTNAIKFHDMWDVMLTYNIYIIKKYYFIHYNM